MGDVSKHSPGPWRWAGFALYGNDGDATGFCFDVPSEAYTEESKSNFRLIAAAPEMLELLRDLEWSGEEGSCPSCHSEGVSPVGFPANRPHRPDCKLAALLARIDGEPEEQCSQCGAVVQGFHACPGVPGEP